MRRTPALRGTCKSRQDSVGGEGGGSGGQLMSYEEDPSFEGYLQVKARLSGWGGRGVRGTAHEL